jgi:hypothetical protein
LFHGFTLSCVLPAGPHAEVTGFEAACSHGPTPFFVRCSLGGATTQRGRREATPEKHPEKSDADLIELVCREASVKSQ